MSNPFLSLYKTDIVYVENGASKATGQLKNTPRPISFLPIGKGQSMFSFTRWRVAAKRTREWMQPTNITDQTKQRHDTKINKTDQTWTFCPHRWTLKLNAIWDTQNQYVLSLSETNNAFNEDDKSVLNIHFLHESPQEYTSV